jgi:hypothetical protein
VFPLCHAIYLSFVTIKTRTGLTLGGKCTSQKHCILAIEYIHDFLMFPKEIAIISLSDINRVVSVMERKLVPPEVGNAF